MTPLLLDQRSIFRAGITISFGMLVVFFSGYYIGHQKADPGTGLGLNKTIALALPRPAHADTAELEPQIPQVQIPGAYIDVDSPQDSAAGVEPGQPTVAQEHKVKTEVETVIQQTTDIIERPSAADTSTGQANQKLQLASLEMAPAILKNGNETDVIEQAADKQEITGPGQQLSNRIDSGSETGITDTASAEDARYTIQVGVFADSENAIRRMSELESKNLSAYTDGYTNKRNELRFNVRFGYFKNKSSALAALNSFEQNLSGSGYITRIRQN